MWLFADDTGDPAGNYWLAGTIGALVTALPVVLAWVLTAIKARSDSKRLERSDVIKEWQQYVDKVELAMADKTKEADQIRIELREIQKELLECEKRSAKQETTAAELKGEINVLQLQVRRLQVRADDTGPGTVQPVIVTVDLKGTILNISPSVAPLLHYLPKELFGKNVAVLVPERFQSAHRIGFDKVAKSGQAPDPDRVVITYALTKEGQEVPVLINLSGWQDSEGRWFLNGEIRRRQSSGDSEVFKPSTRTAK